MNEFLWFQQNLLRSGLCCLKIACDLGRNLEVTISVKRLNYKQNKTLIKQIYALYDTSPCKYTPGFLAQYTSKVGSYFYLAFLTGFFFFPLREEFAKTPPPSYLRVFFFLKQILHVTRRIYDVICSFEM